MSVVSDPDYLAILARGLALATAKFQRQEVQGTEEASARRRGRVLDSLACILISHPKQQAVAVGAVLDGRAPDGGIVLLVSENNPLPETVEHLNAVLARLRLGALEIQLTSSPPLPGFIFAETTSELERKLIELEGFMIHHVWPKLCHRFTKDSRHENFLATATAVCGAPASERMDLSVDERRNLAIIQTFTDLIKKGAVASGDPTTAGGHLDSQQSPGSDFRIRKMPDLHRWLSKVASICSHFKCIVNAAMSNTLGPMLLNVKVERVSNKFPLPRSEISIDREGVTSVLIAAGHKQDTENDEKVKKLEKDVTDFLRHLSEVYNAEPNEKGEFNVEPKLHTHCECLMLTSGIHDRAKAIPYIGVSKLSCAFCQLYFATYREVTGIQIYTRGTHSETAPWTFPPFSGPYAVPFESKFVEKMLAKIGEGWAVYRARPLSHASQSTDRSGEDEEPGLSRRLKRAADSAKQRLEDLIRRNPSWSVAVQDQ